MKARQVSMLLMLLTLLLSAYSCLAGRYVKVGEWQAAPIDQILQISSSQFATKSNNTVSLYNFSNPSCSLAVLISDAKNTSSMAFSNDRNQIVYISNSNKIKSISIDQQHQQIAVPLIVNQQSSLVTYQNKIYFQQYINFDGHFCFDFILSSYDIETKKIVHGPAILGLNRYTGSQLSIRSNLTKQLFWLMGDNFTITDFDLNVKSQFNLSYPDADMQIYTSKTQKIMAIGTWDFFLFVQNQTTKLYDDKQIVTGIFSWQVDSTGIICDQNEGYQCTVLRLSMYREPGKGDITVDMGRKITSVKVDASANGEKILDQFEKDINIFGTMLKDWKTMIRFEDFGMKAVQYYNLNEQNHKFELIKTVPISLYIRNNYFNSLAFSLNGKYFILNDKFAQLKVWNIQEDRMQCENKYFGFLWNGTSKVLFDDKMEVFFVGQIYGSRHHKISFLSLVNSSTCKVIQNFDVDKQVFADFGLMQNSSKFVTASQKAIHLYKISKNKFTLQKKVKITPLLQQNQYIQRYGIIITNNYIITLVNSIPQSEYNYSIIIYDGNLKIVKNFTAQYTKFCQKIGLKYGMKHFTVYCTMGSTNILISYSLENFELLQMTSSIKEYSKKCLCAYEEALLETYDHRLRICDNFYQYKVLLLEYENTILQFKEFTYKKQASLQVSQLLAFNTSNIDLRLIFLNQTYFLSIEQNKTSQVNEEGVNQTIRSMYFVLNEITTLKGQNISSTKNTVRPLKYIEIQKNASVRDVKEVQFSCDRQYIMVIYGQSLKVFNVQQQLTQIFYLEYIQENSQEKNQLNKVSDAREKSFKQKNLHTNRNQANNNNQHNLKSPFYSTGTYIDCNHKLYISSIQKVIVYDLRKNQYVESQQNEQFAQSMTVSSDGNYLITKVETTANDKKLGKYVNKIKKWKLNPRQLIATYDLLLDSSLQKVQLSPQSSYFLVLQENIIFKSLQNGTFEKITANASKFQFISQSQIICHFLNKSIVFINIVSNLNQKALLYQNDSLFQALDIQISLDKKSLVQLKSDSLLILNLNGSVLTKNASFKVDADNINKILISQDRSIIIFGNSSVTLWRFELCQKGKGFSQSHTQCIELAQSLIHINQNIEQTHCSIFCEKCSSGSFMCQKFSISSQIIALVGIMIFVGIIIIFASKVKKDKYEKKTQTINLLRSQLFDHFTTDKQIESLQ